MVRSFLAINLSPEAAKSVCRAIGDWHFLGRSVRWVRPENVHLTVKFLGDISQAEVKDVSTVIQELTTKLRPFKIQLAEPGIFPSLRRPRVLWIGIKDQTQTLMEIQAMVENALFLLGMEKDQRPFVPHITIGRIKGKPPSREGLSRFMRTRIPHTETLVDRLSVMESRLTPTGPVYTSLSIHTFQGDRSRTFKF